MVEENLGLKTKKKPDDRLERSRATLKDDAEQWTIDPEIYKGYSPYQAPYCFTPLPTITDAQSIAVPYIVPVILIAQFCAGKSLYFFSIDNPFRTAAIWVGEHGLEQAILPPPAPPAPAVPLLLLLLLLLLLKGKRPEAD